MGCGASRSAQTVSSQQNGQHSPAPQINQPEHQENLRQTSPQAANPSRYGEGSANPVSFQTHRHVTNPANMATSPEKKKRQEEEEEVNSEEEWEKMPALNFDRELEKEINAKVVNKAGVEVDIYDRDDKRPVDNNSMFQFESAGSGDQALAVKPFLGAIKAPENPPPFQNDRPNIDLELEYIYGYRCFDTRQSIFYTQNSNKIVYMAAAVGIVLDIPSNTQKFMGAGNCERVKGHSDDITALAIAPDQSTIATGEVGRNPKIIVWDCNTMEIKAQWQQADGSRAVTALSFNKTGRILISCALDNDHYVRFWDWATQTALKAIAGGGEKILDASWSHSQDIACTVGMKHIYFWDISAQDPKKRGIFGRTGKVTNMTCVKFLYDGNAVTGGTNGFLYIWSGNQCKKSIAAHQGGAAIHTLNIRKDMDGDSIIYSGGSDKKLNMLNANLETMESHMMEATPRAVDARDDKIIVGLRNGSIIELKGRNKKTIMQSHSDGEVWGLEVSQNDPNILVSSGDDNKLKVWDASRRECIKTSILERTPGEKRKSGQGASTLADTPPNQQARCVTLNQQNGHVAVGHNDGHWTIRQSIDAIETVIFQGKQPNEWIETMRYSPDGQWLAIGSHDNYVYIFETGGYKLKGKCWKHSGAVLGLDWSCDGRSLKTHGGEHDLLFWQVDETGKISQNTGGATGLKDERWNTYSTHFGWHVQGIFGGVIDFTHVNRVDRSPQPDGTFAVANDWGLVELFGNPNSEGAKSQKFRGHSEHVTNVKWNKAGNYLFSAGGYDQCIMQWKKL